MHEMSIAQAIMDEINNIAEANKLEKVECIHLEAGLLKQVVPELMVDAFSAVSETTIADSAELIILEIEPIASCNECGAQFKPEVHDYTCPECKKASCDIIKGDEILITKVTGK